MYYLFFFLLYGDHRNLTVPTTSFPNRRSSDLRKLLLGCRIATWVAIQKVRRNRALPYFDSLVRPRNRPDCRVARSRPQNFRNWRWWPKRRRSPASARIVRALIGPIPGIMRRSRSEEQTSEIQSLMRNSY